MSSAVSLMTAVYLSIEYLENGFEIVLHGLEVGEER